jgi:opacity protein-like surface antigen
MLRNGRIRLACHGYGVALATVFILILTAGIARAQTVPASEYYGRVNTFGFLAAYSNDSSHILLGETQNRKLLNLGGMYSRRLLRNRIVNWQYTAEILPVALESDPVSHYTMTFTSPVAEGPFTETIIPVSPCRDGSGTGSYVIGGVTYNYTFSNTCTRRWTMGEGISPVGFQWNFLPRRKLQPIVLGHGGYMYSTQPIPTTEADSFNFTFDFGVGLELFQTRTRSIRVDYRYHHISDHFTSVENPGIDNGLLTVTYSFGR